MLDYIIRHVRGRKIYYGIRGKHKELDEIRLACSATAINVAQPKKLTKVLDLGKISNTLKVETISSTLNCSSVLYS